MMRKLRLRDAANSKEFQRDSVPIRNSMCGGIRSSVEGSPRSRANVVDSLWLFSLIYVRGRDRARLFRLAGAPGERLHIDWRTNAEHRIVRRRHTRWQHQ